MKQYVIIGGGVAAVGCIEGIRQCDAASSITLVSAETRAPYCRPLISYYLEGKTDLQKMNYRPEDFYARSGVSVRYGVSAEKIDSETQSVTLSDGSTLPYSALCIATGSEPFVPKFEGLETVEMKRCFMTVEDSLAIEKALRPDASVLIIGAGFIGLKCAEGIRDRVAQITVCDLADHILSSILDAESAAPMEKCLEENGIALWLGDTVVRFDGQKAYMKSGRELDFDILVLAVGVRPNVELFRSAGGAVNKGIPVSEKMETSLPFIYAAGDCTECYDVSCATCAVMANMPNAYMQGRCAGVNMAGGEEVFDKGTKMNSIGFFGCHVISAGTRDDGGEVFVEKGENFLKKLYCRDDRLVGYILLGDVERAGIYTALIRNETPLSSFDFEKMKQLPALSAFSADVRKAVLGGLV